MRPVTVCVSLGKIILSICYCDADNHRHTQIWVLLNINSSLLFNNVSLQGDFLFSQVLIG